MENKNWLQFLIAVFVIVLTYQFLFMKKPPPKTGAGALAPGQTAAVDGAPQTADGSTTASLAAAPGGADTPRVQAPPVPADAPAETILVETQSYRIEFNTRGAVPVSWEIVDPEYMLKDISHGDSSHTLEMIPPIPGAENREYPFEFSMKVANRAAGYLDSLNQRVYTHSRETGPEGVEIVRFVSPLLDEGIRLEKTYRIPQRGFLSEVEYKIVNTTDQSLRFEDETHGPGASWAGFIGGDVTIGGIALGANIPESAIWRHAKGTDYEALTKLEPGIPREMSVPVDWMGIGNRYFFAAFAPKEAPEGLRIVAKSRNAPAVMEKKQSIPATLTVFQKPLVLEPNGTKTYSYDVFIGPQSRKTLDAAGHRFDRVLFYSSWDWFRALCLGMMKLLDFLHNHIVSNYGVAIILMTILIRTVMQPLVYIQMKSGARFAQAQALIKPELDEIAKRYKDNVQKRNEETWKLYKKHNVNPFAAMKGCVWIVIQMPIFVALYRILLVSIELRGAHFLWITDLSLPDRLMKLPEWFPLTQYLNILPIVMAGTQFFATKLSMSSVTDPTQRQMMIMMPLMFVFFMYSFSSGLVLYWLVSNIWQVGSQYVVNKIVKREFPLRPATASGPPGASPPKSGK